ncbi:MAG TPA: hypothetical protein VFQ89_07435, partial [Candidatus Binatia bacterium]|nr:hypothetical protein [Candidatus Binatia bacterium]
IGKISKSRIHQIMGWIDFMANVRGCRFSEPRICRRPQGLTIGRKVKEVFTGSCPAAARPSDF